MTESAVTIDRGIVYRTTETGEHLRADVFAPAEGIPRAAVLYFHGGGWEVGERTDHESVRAVALAKRGYLVATISYRLTATAAFPAQREDARAAAAWLREQAAVYGTRSDRIGAWGASAGGHLAALLALGDPQAQLPPAVDAAVAWFAPLDLDAESGGTPLERELFPHSSVDALVGGEFDAGDARHRAADPLSLVSAQAAPLLIATGDRDRVINAATSLRMHEALTRAGATSVLQIFGRAGHEDAALEGAMGIGSIAAFFEEHLECDPLE